MTLSVIEKAPDGSDICQIGLKRDGLSATILTFGAVLQDLRLEGHTPSLVLGYADPKDYLSNPNYFGATVGRYANRIRNGKAQVAGQWLQLDQNTPEGHTLHGGRGGTAHLNWRVVEYDDYFATLSIVLADGHMGFPGELTARVTYRLLEEHTLEIEISAEADRDTICSFAHHSYFNLDGQTTIAGHKLSVQADHYLPVDKTGIPLGYQAKVADTHFDLRNPVLLKDLGALDHTYCLSSDSSVPGAVASLSSGTLTLSIHTDAPGMQIYTGDGIARGGPQGLSGYAYGPRAGIALEPQIWPDAPNHKDFPSAELLLGEVFRQKSQFKFALNNALH